MKPASKRTSHCNKRPFATLLEAQIAVKRTHALASKRGEPIVTSLSPYKCQYCAAWHIGRSKLKGIDWGAVERADQQIKERCAQYADSTRSPEAHCQNGPMT